MQVLRSDGDVRRENGPSVHESVGSDKRYQLGIRVQVVFSTVFGSSSTTSEEEEEAEIYIYLFIIIFFLSCYKKTRDQ